MIYGIGTDIVAIKRLQAFWERHGDKARERLLAPQEYAAFDAASDKGRFLAKRFAAKEAFSKALGTGIRAPATLNAIATRLSLAEIVTTGDKSEALAKAALKLPFPLRVVVRADSANAPEGSVTVARIAPLVLYGSTRFRSVV